MSLSGEMSTHRFGRCRCCEPPVRWSGQPGGSRFGTGVLLARRRVGRRYEWRARVSDRPRATVHLSEWTTYLAARRRLLTFLDIERSNREPMAEFSEVLVRDLVAGELAPSRTEKGWDVRTPDGEKIQVRYLTNRTGNWSNWHWVGCSDLYDWYALVIFIDLTPAAVHMFPATDLTAICTALKKRHANQSRFLSYTYGNYVAISSDPSRFEQLGMRVWDLRSGHMENCVLESGY